MLTTEARTGTGPNTPSDTNSAIFIQGLCVSYEDPNGKGTIHALEDVNLDIRPGEFISLLGPSGCGKTTLLKTLANLQNPTSGIVSIHGMSPREARLQRKFGIVFQSPVLFDWRTVRRNVCMPMEVIGLPPKERTRRVTETLELVGLLKFGQKYPHQLSGGMQQRVGIARALALDPEILLMDEPFSALDEFTKEKLHLELQDIWLKTQKNILFVTHNIQESVFLSDRIVVLSPHPGRVSAVIPVNLPRPRTLDMKGTPEFARLMAQVRGSFEGV